MLQRRRQLLKAIAPLRWNFQYTTSYWQTLLLALDIVRNVMLTGAKLTRPAGVGSPETCGRSPSLFSWSVLPLSCTDVS